MQWKKHSDLEDKHAFLGASKYAWLNYDKKKTIEAFENHLAKEKGTRLHAFAEEAINLGIMAMQDNETINIYINDCIANKMTPEVVLYFSDNCFGTADAISFENNNLKIFDLKTGKGKTKFDQLEIYAALFCLEYGLYPERINMELRIYQNNTFRLENPTADRINYIMDSIIEKDRILNEYWEEQQ